MVTIYQLSSFVFSIQSQKTVQAEYGTSVPMTIDAADMEDGTPKVVYLISGKTSSLLSSTS